METAEIRKVRDNPNLLTRLAMLGIVAVDYEAGELVDEIAWLNQFK